MKAQSDTRTSSNGETIIFRHPTAEDGRFMHDLAIRSRTLDVNSCYHYLIMGRHFSQTSMAAESGGRIVGFVTGYIPPEAPDTLFIWQVAVDGECRGKGIALAMLETLTRALSGRRLSYLDTTITADNAASIALFTALARTVGAPYAFNDTFFSEGLFGKSGHAPETLFRIGPALHSS
ncbi:diaminobutyrate acetyltransferase [Desulfatiferula olefinivorans]